MALIHYWPEPRGYPPPPSGRKTTYPKWWGYEGLLNYPIVTPPNLKIPAEPKKDEASWANWAPYLRGWGIFPGVGGLTATSPALRKRLNPLALTAMESYLGDRWSDYLAYSTKHMSRTPNLSRRHWTYARWR